MLLKRKGACGYDGGTTNLVQANDTTGFLIVSRLSGGRLAGSIAQSTTRHDITRREKAAEILACFW